MIWYIHLYYSRQTLYGYHVLTSLGIRYIYIYIIHKGTHSYWPPVTSIARPQPGASFSCYQCSGITTQWRLGNNCVDVLWDMFFWFCGTMFIILQQKSSCILVFCETDSNECLFAQLELLFVSLQLGRKVIRGCEKALNWASNCWQNQPPNPLAS